MTAEWQKKKLGELLNIQNGYAFDSKAFSPDGKMPLIRIRDLKEGVDTETCYTGNYEQKYVVEAGDLLIGMDGEFGCYEWKGEPALLNQRVCRLQNFKTMLLPRFLFYGINSHLKDIEDVTGFTTVKHLSSKQVLDINFLTPPIPEQQRIVTILDQAFAGIATATTNAEKNLANARAVFESHLQSLFTHKGDGWVEKRLDSICTEITVGHVGSMASRYKQSGVPFLRSQNIRPFEISMENVVYIDDIFHKELKKSRLRSGDLAIVRTGYPGTASVIPPELTEANCSDLVIVRTGDSVSPYYLEAFFNSSFGKMLVNGELVGAAQKHFNVTSAKQVVLSLPPSDQQTTIIGRIREMRMETKRLEAIYQQKLVALDVLKKSILNQAFSGQLQ